MAVTIAACTPATGRPSWTHGPGLASGAPAPSSSPAPSGSAEPWAARRPLDGMFGMVTALIVQDGTGAIDVLPPMADLAVGRTAKVPFICPIPGTSA